MNKSKAIKLLESYIKEVEHLTEKTAEEWEVRLKDTVTKYIGAESELYSKQIKDFSFFYFDEVSPKRYFNTTEEKRDAISIVTSAINHIKTHGIKKTKETLEIENLRLRNFQLRISILSFIGGGIITFIFSNWAKILQVLNFN